MVICSEAVFQLFNSILGLCHGCNCMYLRNCAVLELSLLSTHQLIVGGQLATDDLQIASRNEICQEITGLIIEFIYLFIRWP